MSGAASPSGVEGTANGGGPLGRAGHSRGMGALAGARGTGMAMGRDDNAEPKDAFGDVIDSARVGGQKIYVPKTIDRGLSCGTEGFNNFMNSEFKSLGTRAHPGPVDMKGKETSNYDKDISYF